MVAHGTGGAVTAAGRTIEVTIHGRGGHAATPHLAIDPVLTAAATVLRLQAVVAREVAAAEQVVLTVTSMQAGDGPNLVPDQASLGITIRALHPAALAQVTAAAQRVVRAECAASGCVEPPEFRVVADSPANLPDLAHTLPTGIAAMVAAALAHLPPPAAEPS
jgi:metal-dependent amidase/aminoacylase/carboxypeptidase family protein